MFLPGPFAVPRCQRVFLGKSLRGVFLVVLFRNCLVRLAGRLAVLLGHLPGNGSTLGNGYPRNFHGFYPG